MDGEEVRMDDEERRIRGEEWMVRKVRGDSKGG